MATLSRTRDGKYFVSFICDEPKVLKSSTGRSVGVDVGIKDVAVTSDGWHTGAPRNTYRLARELKQAQRKLSRKKKGSNRRKLQRIKVARIHTQIANARADFLHKLSHKLVAENELIVIENLHVKGMVRNPLPEQSRVRHWHGRATAVDRVQGGVVGQTRRSGEPVVPKYENVLGLRIAARHAAQ